jgi:hypothetical protein
MVMGTGAPGQVVVALIVPACTKMGVVTRSAILINEFIRLIAIYKSSIDEIKCSTHNTFAILSLMVTGDNKKV